MAVLIAVLILGAVLAVVLIAVLVLGTVLLAVLIVHDSILLFLSCGCAAIPVCPGFQDLSLVLKRKPARSPAKTAMVIPPAAASSPPVKMPITPWESTAFFTPPARR